MKLSPRFCTLLFAACFSPLGLSGQTSRELAASSATARQGQVSQSVININDISLWIRNDGLSQPFSFWSASGSWALMYPRGEAGLVYQDGVLWVGKLWDGQQSQIVLGGGRYETGDQPGVILSKGVAEDPAGEAVRTYRYRPDYETADLHDDAAGLYHTLSDSVTDEMITAVRVQYAKDASEWPWQKGAPFCDVNGNGTMDPGEIPGLSGVDQVLWFAYNDLNGTFTNSAYGRTPVGMEVQVTLWAHSDDPDLASIIFKRYRFIFKGTATTPADERIDSMYLMQWSDYDVGYFADDLGGCDSLLSMGFGYNSATPDSAYETFGWQVPAIGYAIMEGPVVPGDPADEAFVSGRTISGFRNLPMTSFWLHGAGTAGIWEDELTHPLWYWYTAQGLFADRVSAVPEYEIWHWENTDGSVTKFPFGGDPSAGTGWLDGTWGSWGIGPGYGYSLAPGSRSLIESTGPFSMALGDTQEVVIAVVAGKGADGPASVDVLKYYIQRLRSVYPHLDEFVLTSASRPETLPASFELLQNYPNPFNPSTTIEYRVPRSSHVRLTIYDNLGREIRVLEDSQMQAGAYTVVWDGKDDWAQSVTAGVYYCRMTAGGTRLARKLLLLK